VPKHLHRLPQDVIDHWPEVLQDVDLEVIPIKYLHAVRVQFKEGKIWDIDLTDKDKKKPDEVEQSLQDLFTHYENDIEHIDFKLDTERIKTDIKKRTASFLKKKK